MRSRAFESIVLAASIAGCGSLLGLTDGTPAKACAADADCPLDQRCIAYGSVGQPSGSAGDQHICYPVVHCAAQGDCASFGPLACAPDGTCRTQCAIGNSAGQRVSTCGTDQMCAPVSGQCGDTPCNTGVGLCYGPHDSPGCDGGACTRGDGGVGGDGGGHGDGGGSTAAPYPLPRAALAAVSASNGIVYAFGGAANATTPTVDVYAYDPNANSWTQKTPMPTARAYHGAARATDGVGAETIVLVGGYDASGMPVSQVDIYSPANDTWKSGMPMRTPRGELGVAFGAPGRVFAVGGRSVRGGSATAIVEAYDPHLDSWQAITTPLPDATVAPAVVSLSPVTTRTYAIGGQAGGTDGSQVFSRDGNGGAWGATASLLQGRIAPGAAMNGTAILVAGGLGGMPLAALTSVELYIEGQRMWTFAAPMHTARTNLAMATYGVNMGATFIAIGGFDSSQRALSVVEIYDLATNTWR